MVSEAVQGGKRHPKNSSLSSGQIRDSMRSVVPTYGVNHAFILTITDPFMLWLLFVNAGGRKFELFEMQRMRAKYRDPSAMVMVLSALVLHLTLVESS